MIQIVPQSIKMVSCGEKDAEVIGMKNGEVKKTQDVDFVKACDRVFGIF